MDDVTGKKWFWAWVILKTIQKEKRHDEDAMSEIWKNLILVQAGDEVQAYQKAVRVGKDEAGDCRGTLRLNGKAAITIFMGLGDLGLVYEEVGDGMEILWQLKRCKQKNAVMLVKTRAELMRVARRERLRKGVYP